MRRLKKFIDILLLLCFVHSNFNLFVFAENVESKTNDVQKEQKKTNSAYQVEKLFANTGKYGLKLYIVKKDDKYGILDDDGNLVLPCKFDSLIRPDNYLQIVAEKSGKYGVYSFEGNLILPVLYDKITYENGFIVTEKDGKSGLFSKEGEKLLDNDYNSMSVYSYNRCILRKGKDWFYYDIKKKISVAIPYDVVEPIFGNMIIFKNNKKGVYNLKAKNLIIPAKYDEIKYDCGGFVVSEGNSKGLYDDNKGNEIFKPVYKNISGKYPFLIAEKPNGKFDIKPIENYQNFSVNDIDKYEIIISLVSGVYFVLIEKDSKWGIIYANDYDKVCSMTLKIEYDEIKSLNDTNYKVVKNGKAALYRIYSGFKTDFLYDDIEYISENYLKIKKDGLFALYDTKTDKMTEFIYQDIRLSEFLGHVQVKNSKSKWHYLDKTKYFTNTAKGVGLIVGIPVAGAVVVAMSPFFLILWAGCSEFPSREQSVPKNLSKKIKDKEKSS